MARSNSIIVGGGIAALSPFTLGALLKVGATSPPGVNDSIVFQRTQSSTTVITVGTNSYPTATEKLQVVGGAIIDTGATGGLPHGSVLIGQGAVTFQGANTFNVVLGFGATSSNTSNAVGNVVIGHGATIGVDQGATVLIGEAAIYGASAAPFGAAVCIGSSSSFGVGNGFSGVGIGVAGSFKGVGVLIGNQVTSGNSVSNYVGIGRLASVQANSQTIIGDNASGVAGHTVSIAIGRNAVTLKANQLVIGAQNVGITETLIGEGDTVNAYAGITHRHTNGTGSNDPAGTVTHQACLGTGNAVGGGHAFSVGIAGASGATLQTAGVALRIEGGTRNIALWSATGTFGSGVGVMFLANATTNPSTNPTAGGILYVNAGALTYRGSGGTVTVIAPA